MFARRSWGLGLARSLAPLAVVLALTSPAVADLPLLRLQVAPGPGGLGPLEGTEVLDVLASSTDFLVGVASRPLALALRVPGLPLHPPTPVAWQSAGEVGFALGLPWEMQAGVALPFALAANGDSSSGAPDPEARPGTALGDLRLHLKWRALALAGPTEPRLLLALAAAVSLPTGTAARFVSEGSATFTPVALGEWHEGPVGLHVSVGYHVRSERVYGDLRLGNELEFGGGLAVRVLPRIDLGAVVFGATAAGQKAETPVEGLGLLRLHASSALTLTLAGGAGLTSGVGAPSARAFLLVGYAMPTRTSPSGESGELFARAKDPVRSEGFGSAGHEIVPRESAYASEPDTDGDGIIDRLDMCPSEAEDYDGFEDDDGCPDRRESR